MQVSVPQFDQVRVLVAGDVMLDRYWFGATQRISPEERPGGAGNVAVNLASLGVHCTVLGITGDDAIADSLTANMEKRGVRCLFTRLKHAATITKLRVLAHRSDVDATGLERDRRPVQCRLVRHLVRRGGRE